MTFDKPGGLVTGTLVNTDHSPTVEIESSDAGAQLTGGPLRDNTYTLANFHVHFGCQNDRGSEHTLNNKYFSGQVNMNIMCILLFFLMRFTMGKNLTRSYDYLGLILIFTLSLICQLSAHEAIEKSNHRNSSNVFLFWVSSSLVAEKITIKQLPRVSGLKLQCYLTYFLRHSLRSSSVRYSLCLICVNPSKVSCYLQYFQSLFYSFKLHMVFKGPEEALAVVALWLKVHYKRYVSSRGK